jgi:hypothetical protein
VNTKINYSTDKRGVLYSTETFRNTVRSESRCELGLRYVDLVVSTEVAVEVCCCFTICSC